MTTALANPTRTPVRSTTLFGQGARTSVHVRIPLSIAFACCLLFTAPLLGSDYALKTTDHGPPKEISDAIRSSLQPKAIQVLKGNDVVFEFWLNNTTPFKAKPESGAKAFQALKEGTLIGAAVVHGGQRDYRDDDLSEGTYTMRFGLQPSDGNHLGTTEFPFFALLVPAKSDPKPDTIPSYKALVKASSSGTTTDHPRVLSLRPASETPSDTPKLNSPLPDHKSIRLQLPGTFDGAKSFLPLELVFEGKAKK